MILRELYWQKAIWPSGEFTREIQFHAITSWVFEEYLKLSGLRYIVDVVADVVLLQAFLIGRRIQAIERGVVEGGYVCRGPGLLGRTFGQVQYVVIPRIEPIAITPEWRTRADRQPHDIAVKGAQEFKELAGCAEVVMAKSQCFHFFPY